MKALALGLMFLRAASVLAQQGATAQLTGTVASEGQPLAGVTVTIASDALPSVRSAITGSNGGYFVGLLPPGEYRVRFDLDGFAPREQRLYVALGDTTRLNIDMRSATVAETVTVHASSAHAPSGALIASNIRASRLDDLPTGRDIGSAVLLSSNATDLGPQGRTMIAGAPSWDSLYLIDGVTVNEYLTGQPHNLFIEDAIEEIAVQTGAISAEYGRFTGGVVITLTRRGGNEYGGSVRDSMRNAAWTLRTPWSGAPEAPDKIDHQLEATLGGFVLRDRLWFFSAGHAASTSTQSFTSQTNVPYASAAKEQRWEAKFTAQLAPNHAVIASYMNTLLSESNATDLRSSGRVLDLSALIPHRSQPTNLAALTYEGVIAPSTFLEIHASTKRYALRGNGGRSRDRVLGTLIAVRNLNANMNAPLGCGICGDDARHNESASAKASHYTNSRAGNHTIDAGADRFVEQRTTAGSRSASEYNIQANARVEGGIAYPIFDSNALIVWNRPRPSIGARFENRSAFVNDRWDVVPRLSVNVGMRYDRNRARDGVAQPIANDAAWSPRLAVTFDVRHDGRHRVSASHGRYASKILDSGGAPQQIGVFDQYGWRYSGPPINAGGGPPISAHEALARLFAWFDSQGGVQNRSNLRFFTDPILTTFFPRSLRTPCVDENAVGYAVQFSSGFVRADYIVRDWKHFYAGRVDTTTGQRINADGERVDVAWVINDDNATTRTYRALQLQTEWRSGRTSAGGSYTRSRLRGNDDEEEGTLNAPRNLPLPLWYPELLGYAQRRPIGYLLQDQRHRARAWIGHELSARRALFSAFLLQSFQSGHAYSIVGTIDPARAVFDGMAPNPGYALNQVKTGAYYFSRRGALRTDSVFSTDIALRFEIPVGITTMFIKGAVVNAFNNAAVERPSTEVITASSNSASGLLRFNPFTEKPVEGVHYRLASDFGKATGPESYQTPRTFQLAVGARF